MLAEKTPLELSGRYHPTHIKMPRAAYKSANIFRKGTVLGTHSSSPHSSFNTTTAYVLMSVSRHGIINLESRLTDMAKTEAYEGYASVTPIPF